ncbi:MAG: 4Fe-4S ferredoxin [Asgard group archaeon]|nr:4Fe-4S ferredoxin [Asgard group archaeon]
MAIDVYRRLQEHFDSFPIRFPATESGVEIRLLKQLFTPEEAEIALVLKCGYPGLIDENETIDAIFNRVKHLGFSKKEVEQHLAKMAKNGAIAGITKDGKKIYVNAPLIIGIYEFQVDKLTEEFQKDLDQYKAEAYWPANNVIGVGQLRTIPVGIKIKHENPIIKYDDIKIQFEKSEGPFAKMNCVCRQSKDLKNESCQVTNRREVCLAMGEMGQLYVEQGYGSEITKEEALQYLKKNEEEGLIFQVSNSQEMIFVCSCCTCCCEGLAFLKRIPNPADYASSNYQAVVDEELCSGCGNCIDRCQIDAITLEGDYAVILEKRCIGCGNCIIDCPEEAISLISKENPRVPPLTTSDLFEKIAERRKEVEAKSDDN